MNIRNPAFQRHIQDALNALEGNPESKKPNFTKYLEALIELGKAAEKIDSARQNHSGQEDDDQKGSSGNPKLAPRILHAIDAFDEVWHAEELDRVQIEDLGHIDEDLSPKVVWGDKGNDYQVKKCVYRVVLNEDLVFSDQEGKELKNTQIKKGKSYKAKGIPKPLISGAAYIRINNQLFFIDNETEELLCVSEQFDEKNENEIFGESKFQELEEQKVTYREIELDEPLLLKLIPKINHAPIKDERHLAANFHFNFSTKKYVEEGLQILQAYIGDEQDDQKSEDSESFEEEYFNELDKEAYQAIKKYRTPWQRFLSKLGIISAAEMSITFGLVEGGVAVLLLLSGWGTPLIAAKCIGIAWGLLSTYMQWRAYGEDTPDILIDVHGKDRLGEGFVVYYDEFGFHELSSEDKKKLAAIGILTATTGIAIGVLSYNSFFYLATLLSVGVTVAFPPAALVAIAIFCIVGITINITYMLTKAYAKLLQQKKSVWEYLTDPIKKTFATIDENKEIQYPTATKILAGVFIFLSYALGIAGLAVSAITASNSLASFSNDLLHTGPTAATYIGIGIGAIGSFFGRCAFTLNRAITSAKIVITKLFSKNKDQMKVHPLEAIAATAVSVETAAFFQTREAISNPILNAVGSSATGVREFQGELGGIVKEDHQEDKTSERLQRIRVSKCRSRFLRSSGTSEPSSHTNVSVRNQKRSSKKYSN